MVGSVGYHPIEKELIISNKSDGCRVGGASVRQKCWLPSNRKSVGFTH